MLSMFPLVYIAFAVVVLMFSGWMREHFGLAPIACATATLLLASMFWMVRKLSEGLDFYSGSYATIIKGAMVRVEDPKLKDMWIYQFQAEAIGDLMRNTAGAARSDYLVPMSESTTMGYMSGLRNPTCYHLFISEFAPRGEQQRSIETFERLKIRHFVARRSQFLPGGPQLGSNLKRYAPEILRYLIARYEVLPLGTGFVLLERKPARSAPPA